MQTKDEKARGGLKSSALALNIETVKDLSAVHGHRGQFHHTSLVLMQDAPYAWGQGRHGHSGHTTGPAGAALEE